MSGFILIIGYFPGDRIREVSFKQNIRFAYSKVNRLYMLHVRMSYVHLQLEGKTGCSVQLQKVPLPVHWSIQWLRWQKPMSLTFINA